MLPLPAQPTGGKKGFFCGGKKTGGGRGGGGFGGRGGGFGGGQKQKKFTPYQMGPEIFNRQAGPEIERVEIEAPAVDLTRAPLGVKPCRHCSPSQPRPINTQAIL